MEYDALNHARNVTYPTDVNGERKIIIPTYNKSGALYKVDLKDKSGAAAVSYVDRIAYDAKEMPLNLIMERLYCISTTRKNS